jgi:hypothetical protein
MNIVLVLFLANVVALGEVRVTSQEQFGRLRQGGSPEDLNYNFERAYLEARASNNCPAGSKAFFNVHVSEQGEVKRVKGRLVALSIDLRSVALKWADGVLKQLHFRPLMYGDQPSSVDMALTLVCRPSSSSQ